MMQCPQAAKTQLLEIPNGVAGTRATLSTMRRIVREYKKNPDIRATAARLVQHVPNKAYAMEAKTIALWVRNHIRYTRDVNEVETVYTPDRILENRYGDCDDHALLVATLLESIGHPTRFVAIGLNRAGPFQHVYTETKIGNRWYPLETTEKWEIGSMVNAPRRMVIYNRG
jgi:transglutaminase-like putative cysteine protease